MESEILTLPNTNFTDNKKLKPKAFCNKQFDFLYDIIAALISLFDIITDIWILVQWYYENRMIFFTTSLIILILANFAYVLVFNIRYGDAYKHNPLTLCCCTCFALPFAPLLSFIFYFFHSYDSDLCCFHFYHYYQRKDESKSREWMENKLSKHIGFLMEAIMEAFPQSILQMIAIMYYNEFNIIPMISIIVSMISVSSKSLIFSAATSINIKTMVFTWIYAVCDFFAIFFVLSFVFYNGDIINETSIETLRNIWFYKIYIITIPTCFICSIPIFVWGVAQIQYEMWDVGSDVCEVIIAAFFVLPLWALGMLLGTMMLEILCYSYLAYAVYKCCHGRIPSTASAIIWIKILNWIQTSPDILARICCVNRELLLMKNNDSKLYEYLEQKEHSTQYSDITYSSLHQLYGNILLERFKLRALKHWTECVMMLVFLYYGLSRIVTFFFPVLVIIVITINGQSVMYDLPLFQRMMLFVMFGMIVIMIIMFLVVYKEERIIFYILPLRVRLYSGIEDYLLRMIISYYERLIIKPLIKDVLLHIFGSDIGLLMFQFMPFELEEEEHAKQLTLKASKYTKEIRSTIKNSVQQAMFRTAIL